MLSPVATYLIAPFCVDETCSRLIGKCVRRPVYLKINNQSTFATVFSATVQVESLSAMWSHAAHMVPATPMPAAV